MCSARPATRRRPRSVDEGLLEPGRFDAGKAVLTQRGRLLADGIAIRLLD